MSKFLNLTVAATLLMTAAPAMAEKMGLGRPALPEEIAAWDIDVQPDGTGLPVGSGNALDGEEIFADACASCHGDFAEGVDNWPKLAGGDDTLADEDPLKTVGSYWPYLSTTWDYVNRSMPFGNAQSLSNDEVYAIVAYILYSNDLIDEEFELSNETFLDVEMPNAGGFVIDDRGATEYAIWRAEPCMENCKDSVEITMRATVLDVTPDEEAAEAPAAPAAQAEVVKVAAVVEPEPAPEPEPEVPAFDEALAAKGEKVFKKCKSCHQIGEGAKHKSGPMLNAIYNASVGVQDGFRYSKVMAGHGGVWDDATLAEFLAKPRKAMKGTKMSFAGLRKDAEIAAVIEYLKRYSQ